MTKIKPKLKNDKKMTGQEFLKYLADHPYKGKNAPRDLSTNDEYLYGIKGKY